MLCGEDGCLRRDPWIPWIGKAVKGHSRNLLRPESIWGVVLQTKDLKGRSLLPRIGSHESEAEAWIRSRKESELVSS